MKEIQHETNKHQVDEKKTLNMIVVLLAPLQINCELFLLGRGIVVMLITMITIAK